MKYLFLTLLLSSCATSTFPPKNMSLSEASYASGCYQASIYVCEKYVKTPERFTCYEEMNGLCPDGAKRFRSWVEKANK